MKLIHTADWHLGQRFGHKNRQKEHAKALDWLADFIKTEEVELLIIAGDVFDTDSPPNYARKLYYNFLKKLIGSCCKDIVVIAGNHDSPNMLDASKDLLALLNVHVVGHISDKRTDEILPIYDEDDNLKALIGAVPFLRDRDVRISSAGETSEARIANLKAGIHKHYQEVATALATQNSDDLPVIVTGHLYASGGQRGDRQNTIHIGSLDMIEASSFSPSFDYVALGHLHRPQKVNDEERIRYSGSLIPLDFSELNYDHVVKLVEFEGKKLKKVRSVKVPLARKLRYYTGNMEYISEKLKNLPTEVELDTWLKIDVETEHYQLALQDQLNSLVEDKPAEIITFRQFQQIKETENETEKEAYKDLSQISELEVFQMRLNKQGTVEPKEQKALEDTFAELLSWMGERDEE